MSDERSLGGKTPPGRLRPYFALLVIAGVIAPLVALATVGIRAALGEVAAAEEADSGARVPTPTPRRTASSSSSFR